MTKQKDYVWKAREYICRPEHAKIGSMDLFAGLLKMIDELEKDKNKQPLPTASPELVMPKVDQ